MDVYLSQNTSHSIAFFNVPYRGFKASSSGWKNPYRINCSLSENYFIPFILYVNLFPFFFFFPLNVSKKSRKAKKAKETPCQILQHLRHNSFHWSVPPSFLASCSTRRFIYRQCVTFISLFSSWNANSK